MPTLLFAKDLSPYNSVMGVTLSLVLERGCGVGFTLGYYGVGLLLVF